MLILLFWVFFSKQTRLWEKLCNRQKRGLSKANKAFCFQPADSIWYFSPLSLFKNNFSSYKSTFRRDFRVSNDSLLGVAILMAPLSRKIDRTWCKFDSEQFRHRMLLKLAQILLSSLFGTLGTLWRAMQAWGAPISKFSATQEDLLSFYSNNSNFIRLWETSLHNPETAPPKMSCINQINQICTSRYGAASGFLVTKSIGARCSGDKPLIQTSTDQSSQ